MKETASTVKQTDRDNEERHTDRKTYKETNHSRTILFISSKPLGRSTHPYSRKSLQEADVESLVLSSVAGVGLSSDACKDQDRLYELSKARMGRE